MKIKHHKYFKYTDIKHDINMLSSVLFNALIKKCIFKSQSGNLTIQFNVLCEKKKKNLVF